jgi:hypothetical protein
MKPNRVIFTTAIAVAALGLVPSAPAALFQEMVNYGTAASPLSLGSSEVLTLGRFDSSLGTLTGVTFKMFSYDTVSSVIFNSSAQTIGFSSATATIPITVALSDISGDLDALTTTVSGTAGPFSGSVFGPGSTVVGSAGLAEQTASLATALAPYEGSGQFSFDLSVADSIGAYSGNASSSLFFGGDGDSYGTVEVQYNYIPFDPIPEGSTLWTGLGVAGICVVGAARRFRQVPLPR